MSYSFTSKVRYSEMDARGHLSLHGVLNYFQDCCTFNSQSVGQGMEVLQKRKKGWVLSAWQIVLERYPSLGEELVITTWPYDFKGFKGSRNFTLCTVQGEGLAYANTLWTYVNTVTGLPIRLTEEDTKGYELNDKLDMDYAPRKIGLPQGGEKCTPFPVIVEYLDTNHHVNNAQYVALAQRCLPVDFVTWQMRAEYKKQAVLGDVLVPVVYKLENGYIVALNSRDGEPYAVVEFLERSPED